jgi:glycosyltransferase involved in cell wall biosynthesis
MKVAMVVPSKESERAISSYTSEISKNLKKQNVDVENVSYEAGKPLSLLKSLSSLKKYDIIHMHHEYNLLGWYGIPFFFVFFFLKFLKKKALITMMHTVLSQKEEFKGCKIKIFLRKKLYFFQNKLINWASDCVVVTMQSQKDILVKEYGANPDKVKVFFSGWPTNVKIIPKNKAKKELNLSGQVYLIIGNLVPDHGAEKILKQADKIGKTILIVSNPHAVNDRNEKRLSEHLNYLKDIVKKNNFEEYVQFDIVPINDKMPLWWKYFSAADIVLQPYRKGIGSGIFLHAMASETPVVANDTEFFNEIKKKFDCLRIAKSEGDYSSEIKKAMSRENYQEMKKGCKEYKKENSWEKICSKYKELYESFM